MKILIFFLCVLVTTFAIAQNAKYSIGQDALTTGERPIDINNYDYAYVFQRGGCGKKTALTDFWILQFPSDQTYIYGVETRGHGVTQPIICIGKKDEMDDKVKEMNKTASADFAKIAAIIGGLQKPPVDLKTRELNQKVNWSFQVQPTGPQIMSCWISRLPVGRRNEDGTVTFKFGIKCQSHTSTRSGFDSDFSETCQVNGQHEFRSTSYNAQCIRN